VAVEGKRVGEQRLDVLGRQIVPAQGYRLGIVERQVAQHRSQRSGVHQSDRHAASDGGVGARPRVGQRHDTGGNRRAVDHIGALPVFDLGHHLDVGDRLGVDPVGNHRIRTHDLLPAFGVHHAPHRGVLRTGDQAHSPGPVVGGQREDRDRSVWLQQPSERGWHRPVSER
jgi:hypothetical protein